MRTVAEYQFISLREKPEYLKTAAQWFSGKWSAPYEAYMECMEAYLKGETPYGWYLCLQEGQIVGGAGVIESHHQGRPVLTPNIGAVFTEEAHRSQSIPERLLNMAQQELGEQGISLAYLVADYGDFYERDGWVFMCAVPCGDEAHPAKMYIHS